MSFTFTLAAVLRLRQSVEEREQRKLEQLQLEIARTRTLLTLQIAR